MRWKAAMCTSRSVSTRRGNVVEVRRVDGQPVEPRQSPAGLIPESAGVPGCEKVVKRLVHELLTCRKKGSGSEPPPPRLGPMLLSGSADRQGLVLVLAIPRFSDARVPSGVSHGRTGTPGSSSSGCRRSDSFHCPDTVATFVRVAQKVEAFDLLDVLNEYPSVKRSR